MKKLLILACLLMFTYSFSQNKDTLTYRYPSEIKITGTRIAAPLGDIPFAASIVSPYFLSTLPRSVAMDEALQLVPGVKVDNQANGSRVHLSIRGIGILTERGIRGIKVLMDGLPLNDPSGFAPDFFDIDYANLQSIEVLRGAAASLYGGSASGGVLNIVTKSGEPSNFGGSVFGDIGSNKFWKAGLQLGGILPTFNYRLSASRTMGDGYRVHTHFQGNNIYFKGTYTPSDAFQITPILGYTKYYHENPEGINLAYFDKDPKLPNDDAVPYNEFLETKRFIGGFTGGYTIDANNSVLFNAYTRSTNFIEANNHTFTHRDLTTPGGTVQYVLNVGKPHFTNNISAGVDFGYQKIDEYRTQNIYSVEQSLKLSDETYKQTGVGLFIFDNIKFGPMYGLSLSLRYDNIKNELVDNQKAGGVDFSGNANFNRATGRIGFTFSPYKELNLYANYGQGFLPPATEELAQNPDAFGGFNTHLTYSKSNSIDFGFRGVIEKAKLHYDVAAFYMTTDNDFDRYRLWNDPLRNQETFYRNAGATKRFGAEVVLDYSPCKYIFFQMAYTYSNFKYDVANPLRIVMDDTSIVKYLKKDNFLPNSPEHQLVLDLQFFPIDNLTIGLNTFTQSKSYIDGANIESEAAEAYTLLNARISYHLELHKFYSIDLSISGKNLTDKKYAAFTEPDPGGNAYQPGAGREFFGGIKFNF